MCLPNIMTHQRRAKKIGPTVAFTSQMPLTMNKVEFIANKVNKQKFIALLGQELEKASCTVYHASGDADVLIIQKAVQSAQTMETILIGEDTDLLVLLCYYATPKLHPLYFMSEPKRNSKNRLWCMQSVISQLGSDICNNILFLHAILGCDTTSRLHGIGKGNSIKKFQENKYFSEQVMSFNSTSASIYDITTAGENVLVSLYSGKPGETLNVLRYKKFFEKVANRSSHVQPQSLPPTSTAAKYHSFCVHCQIQQWMGRNVSPEEWGWNRSGDGFVPI